jgi:PPM family protein phosphatase
VNETTTIPGGTSQAGNCILTLGSESIAGKRKENQDRVAHFESPFGHVFVLADGMGGYEGGSIASSIAATQLPLLLKMIPVEVGPGEALVQAIRELNLLILEKARESGAVERGMGSTVAALLVCSTPEGLLAVGAHVGDSRIYFFRAGKTFCLTRDHTVVQQLIDMGSLTPVQAENHPQASVLTRALGRGDTELAVDLTQWLLLRPNDKLLLC